MPPFDRRHTNVLRPFLLVEEKEQLPHKLKVTFHAASELVSLTPASAGNRSLSLLFSCSPTVGRYCRIPSNLTRKTLLSLRFRQLSEDQCFIQLSYGRGKEVGLRFKLIQVAGGKRAADKRVAVYGDLPATEIVSGWLA
jgi:hypothetical protein